MLDNSSLLDFLRKSPTPFHAVSEMQKLLLAVGFTKLNEAQDWAGLAPGKYVIERDGSIIAVVVGRQDVSTTGLRMFGAHTDSPCLKLKPKADVSSSDYKQVGVQVYGGALLQPWFDRDLGLAGKVVLQSTTGELQHVLYDSQTAIGVIPSLAIHLHREANEKPDINRQKHLPPLLGMSWPNDAEDFSAWLLEQLKAQCDVAKDSCILAHDLSLYDTQPPAAIGLNQELLASARLDNLLSCFVGLQAIMAADGEQSCVLVCNDHEEVGSQSASGAQGPFLKQVLDRVWGDDIDRALPHSMLVSADNAHAVHPNYREKHDANHGPLLNAGPVIKINANQRYASDAKSIARFKAIAAICKVDLQEFAVRSDMACGSTIGPITAAELGVNTIDVGIPQLGMHSIRETAAFADVYALVDLTTQFYNTRNLP